MNSKIIASGLLRATGILTLICLLLYFIYQIQTIIIYIIISVILSLIANPIIEFLKNRLKFSNALAVSVTLLLFLLFLLGLISLFVPLIISQGDNLSLLDTKSIETKLVHLYAQFDAYLSHHNIDIDRVIKESDLTSKLKFNYLTDFFN